MLDYDRAIASGRISLLHEGRSSRIYLSAAQMRATPMLYKEFLSRNLWETPKAILFGSRARRAWRAHQLLASFGFRVPTIVDVIERRGFLGSQRSVLKMGYQENVGSLRQFLPSADIEQRREVLHLLATEVACMHNAGIAHDDMNLGNVLLQHQAGGQMLLVWTDIERVRRCLSGRFGLCSAQVTKNLRQIRKIEIGLKRSEKRYFFRCYIRQLGATRREVRKALVKIMKSGVY